MKAPQRIKAGALQLNVLDTGAGEPLLLLHGFPDFHYGWRKQVPVFEDEGYRLIVPDQRGYNLSDKPNGAKAYQLDLLGQDMLNLLDSLGIAACCVIGHDWGGEVAWWLAHHHPQRVKGAVILNAPHPRSFQNYIKQERSQLFKSWYMFAFQLPGLPEWALSRGRFVHFAQNLKDGAKRGAFTEQDLEKYREAWSQPGAFTAMLNWYRAILQAPAKPFPSTAIKPPVLILWGKKDAYLEAGLAEASLQECAAGKVEYAKYAGHWVQHDDPEWVNDQIRDFLQQIALKAP